MLKFVFEMLKGVKRYKNKKINIKIELVKI